MIKEVIDRIFKTQLALKIWYYTFLVTLLVILAVGVVANHFFEGYISAKYIASADGETSYVAESLSENYYSIMQRFVKITVGADFVSSISSLLGSRGENYTRINNSMQEIFNEYKDMSPLITSAMIVTKQEDVPSTFYYSYYTRMDKSIHDWSLGFSLQDMHGITILPGSTMPYTNQKASIPVAIPMTYSTATNFVLIADSVDLTDFMLYLFMGTEEVSDFLKLYCNDNTEGILYLVNKNGDNLSLTSADKSYETVSQDYIKQAVGQAVSSNTRYLRTENDHLFVYPVASMDLYLVNIIPHSLFVAQTSEFHVDILWLGVFSLLIITCLSLFVSKLVTRPLKILMRSVNNIEDGTYEKIAEIRSHDEIGQLNRSIDSMYNTIQQQFLAIKKEEAEKYEAKIQVLNEQINPHFIYNALEFINMEIMNENTDNASGMVTNLGNYLRSSLAADDMILIFQELEQIRVYLHIMNYRFNNSIKLSTFVDEPLKNCKILKNILQPLVENSIKYGFQLMMNYYNSVVPLIAITFTIDGDWMVMTISDNGSGFDPASMRETMLLGSNDKKRKHIGLHNIYERLTAFYKTVELDFTSIPFVENTIVIRIPCQFFQKSGEQLS